MLPHLFGILKLCPRRHCNQLGISLFLSFLSFFCSFFLICFLSFSTFLYLCFISVTHSTSVSTRMHARPKSVFCSFLCFGCWNKRLSSPILRVYFMFEQSVCFPLNGVLSLTLLWGGKHYLITSWMCLGPRHALHL